MSSLTCTQVFLNINRTLSYHFAKNIFNMNVQLKCSAENCVHT